ncbi:GNAT family N-acetyltransferase [Tamlana agarivorans]|uniref:GNAT family N-acetyltransferase n=1 Tax=Pseudotamlana agarivorans TaxID=481183 RepID=A0ACC5UB69_9FLAO|nr:GNAT family N-acetyltransferase [Tamlana agarivorans]MBU2951573.1 GNAT family N-acetyltransferase [Tamlana agarivorans]
MSQYKIFETERLILKPVSEEDAKFILELFNTPKWIAYIGDRNVKTIGDAKNYIREKMLPQLHSLGYSNYILTQKEDSSKIGTCGLYDREGLDGIDIGFAFLPQYEKKGVAYESANKLKHIGFSEIGLTRINAITRKDNMSSQKLLKKLGMIPEGTTNLPNDEVEWLLFKIEKEQFIAQESQ